MKKLKFHEDTIFKNNGQKYGQTLIEIMKIKGKIIKVHQTEYSVIDPKMYKPDLVFELDDKIIILEFQSSFVNTNDKKRFRFYSALFDQIKNKSNKNIEVHVLSTVEHEKKKCYKVNPESRFAIYIHSLKEYNGDKFLNMMNVKIGNKEELNEKELLMISLLCFMNSKKDMKYNILDSAITIINIKNLNEEIGQFIKGVVLLLCDKFIKDESLNTTISNLIGGNMKIVEDYAQRKVDEAKRQFVINLDKIGFTIEDIAKTADVSPEFVKKALSK